MRKLKTPDISIGEYVNESLFPTYFVKPDFMTTEDVSTLQRLITLLGGMREIFVAVPEDYNDAQVMQEISRSVQVWSTERKPLFEKVYSLMGLEYNPLENYDRYEEGYNTHSESSTSNGTSTSNSTSNGTSFSAGAGDSTSKIMPIDKTSESDLVTSGGAGNSTEGITSSNDSARGNTSSNASGRTAGESMVNSHIHGNIGIIDNVALLTKELGMRGAFGSAIRYIAETFLADFAMDYYSV